jgi:hypothetical protein
MLNRLKKKNIFIQEENIKIKVDEEEGIVKFDRNLITFPLQFLSILQPVIHTFMFMNFR